MTNYSINTLLFDFDSVLAMQYEGIITMFKMLEAFSLRKFLGCSARVSEPILDEFFTSAKIEHDFVLFTVRGLNFNISQMMFANTFDLLETVLLTCNNIPLGNVKQRKTGFSLS